VEPLYVPAFYLRGEYTCISYGNAEPGGLGSPFRVLPYLKSASALKVDCYAGVPLLGFTSGVGEHPFGYGVVLKDLDVETEHLYVPVPGLSEVRGADPDLLYRRNGVCTHSIRFY